MKLSTDEIASPLGTIVIAASKKGLCALDFGDCRERMELLLQRYYGSVELVREDDPLGYSDRIRSYLAGHLDALDSLVLDTGGTEFQREVWAALRRIPCGATTSYADVAKSIGRPRAVRAVGMANAKNPYALVVPCHRVIAANGTLNGYAGGVDRKRWLLRHEGVAI